MKTYTVTKTATINAPAAHVYNIIADYNEGHQAILPRDYFDEMIVTKGGHGAGTEIDVYMSVMGVKAEYHMVVSEPEPGRVIAEEDAAQNTRTTFTVEPIEATDSCTVTISTTSPVKAGLQGWIEKMINPRIMRRIYQEELANLNRVAQAKLQPTS